VRYKGRTSMDGGRRGGIASRARPAPGRCGWSGNWDRGKAVLTVFALVGLRILNADAQSIAGFLPRLQHALLDLADNGFRRLHFLAGLLKPGDPLVDKFVAKQLIGSQRQQNLKFRERQVQTWVFVIRFVAWFLALGFVVGGQSTFIIAEAGDWRLKPPKNASKHA